MQLILIAEIPVAYYFLILLTHFKSLPSECTNLKSGFAWEELGILAFC